MPTKQSFEKMPLSYLHSRGCPTRSRQCQSIHKVDCKNGYWQVPLDQESSLLTMSNTPFGQYKWKMMPFGISPAGEIFQRHLDQAIEGLEGVRTVADDILIIGNGASMEEAVQDHDAKLKALLNRCREERIKLNRDKTEFKMSMPYIGHLLTSEGVKADPRRLMQSCDCQSQKMSQESGTSWEWSTTWQSSSQDCQRYQSHFESWPEKTVSLYRLRSTMQPSGRLSSWWPSRQCSSTTNQINSSSFNAMQVKRPQRVFATRRQTHCLREQGLDPSRVQLRTDRERAVGNHLWCWVFPSVHVWKTSEGCLRS